MTNPEFEPVRKEMMIKTSQARAFRAFTGQMDRWWPRSHHIGKVEMKKVILEPLPGGRWYEVGIDGSECTWGKVLVWQPFEKVVLAWQLNANWEFDPGLITEVELNFLEVEPNLTRLTFEHRNMERFGVQAHEIRRAFDAEGGWMGMLKELAKVAEN